MKNDDARARFYHLRTRRYFLVPILDFSHRSGKKLLIQKIFKRMVKRREELLSNDTLKYST